MWFILSWWLWQMYVNEQPVEHISVWMIKRMKAPATRRVSVCCWAQDSRVTNWMNTHAKHILKQITHKSMTKLYLIIYFICYYLLLLIHFKSQNPTTSISHYTVRGENGFHPITFHCQLQQNEAKGCRSAVNDCTVKLQLQSTLCLHSEHYLFMLNLGAHPASKRPP